MPDSNVSLLNDSRVKNLVIAALAVFIVFLLATALTELKGLRFIGSGVSATNTITVSGEGEVFAVPDTAEFSVSIQEEAEDVATAQEEATEKGSAIIAHLKDAGIEDKDIRTTEYSVYPRYEYSQSVCPASSSGEVVYCPPGRQTLTGYQVSQTLSVKVRDTEEAGDILSGVGTLGASQVSGLSFTVDDEDALQADARGKAIDDAREKARALADQLGVSLVRIVGFSENGNYPVYNYAKAEFGVAQDAALGGGGAPSPSLPTGENKIISNVTVTYEIR